MQRRAFFKSGALATLSTSLLSSFTNERAFEPLKSRAKNIIFLVSDGMSVGTLNLADLYLQRKEGRSSHWMQLYREGKARRALMDTASASSLVTDSAAASSAWGGGVRVNNGALNVSAKGEEFQPILQKFKAAGKAVGCVTTVPITHATPAGFCVNSKSRGSMDSIAEQYLSLRFDVMMGGGTEVFSKETRKDQKDLFSAFASKNFQVATTRDQMKRFNAASPILAVFHADGLPYHLDRQQDKNLQATIPTLAEMTSKAIDVLKGSPKGFVLQVESGKVDWAAHANDIGGLIHEQIAFDDAIKVALDFAAKDPDTLLIMTTDHGNSNPGLLSGSKANKNFDRIHQFKHTNDWVLNGITDQSTVAQVIERFEYAQGIVLEKDQAAELLKSYARSEETGVYNERNLPYQRLAAMQSEHTSIGWAGKDHTADYVELAMVGPGSELLPSFVKNTDLHNFMLHAARVKA